MTAIAHESKRRSRPYRCWLFPIVMLALWTGLSSSCANRSEPRDQQPASPTHTNVTGQVLLPNGFARRGVELHVTTVGSNGALHDRWIPFDDTGHFSHALDGELWSVAVSAGSSDDVFELKGGALAKLRGNSPIDVGEIDLRDRLIPHRLTVHGAEGTQQGEVRVGMWFEPPARGPFGGSVSLGSRQFPPVVLGQAQEWLIPLDAKSVYFLVERPVDESRGTEWRSERHHLFGPFAISSLPAELVMD
ncbi:MAG: hypothetical protein P8N31_03145 [Planctomycetota bacterium]|nr:hypothetical protein [Planctomycetota bacterium]MDG2142528.1 hypothetical protein [Planctomycetota bacterium]